MPQPRYRCAKIRRGWLIALGGLVALIALGPMIVAMTPARDAALATLLPAEAGRLTSRGGTLGWVGPIGLDGVELRDPAGAIVFSAERVEVASGLLQLATDGAAPLRVRVVRPTVDLQVSPAGSNLDTILAAFEKRQAEVSQPADPNHPAAAGRAVSVEVVEGRARVTDTQTGERWVAEGVGATIDDAGRGVNELEITASGRLTATVPAGAPQPPAGDFTLRVGASQDGGRLARVRASSLPLSALGPVLRRDDPTAGVAGWVSVEGDAAWQPLAGSAPADPFRQLLAGRVVSSGRVTLAGAEYRGAATGGEALRLDAIEAPWRFTAAGDRLVVEQLEARASVGTARADGAIRPEEVDAWRRGQMVCPGDLRVAADLDLRRLAEIAPDVLRLREGVRIDSGRVRLNLTGERSPAGPRLSGGLRAESLAGVSAGRQVAWRDPLDVQFKATQRAAGRGLAGWAVESLRCESAFFHATASGGADRVEGQARIDLDRLATELSQFVDLGGVRLAGRGETRFTVRQNAARDRWRLDANGSVEQLLVGLPSQPLASEPRLGFTAAIDAAADGASPPSGRVELSAGEDRLVVQLTAGAGPTADRPFNAELSGDLANWFRRARIAAPGLPTTDTLRLAGRVEATAAGTAGVGGGKIDQFNATFSDLAVDAAGAAPVRVREQQLVVKGGARWDATTGVVESPAGELATSAVSMRTRGVRFNPSVASELRGEAVFRGDVGRLAAWFPPAEGPPRWAAAGQIDGNAKLQAVAEGLLVDVTTTGQGLRLGERQPGGAPIRDVWSEPRMKVHLKAIVEPGDAASATTALNLKEVRAESTMLNGSGGGRIEDLATLRGVQLSGGIDYDLEKLTPLLWPRLGDGVRLVGKERATFQLASDDSVAYDPAANPLGRLRAKVEAPWQGADLFGLPVGPGRLVASLDRGVVRTEPLAVTVGQGKLTTQASATLDPPPSFVQLAPGPMVAGVAISPEVAERFLKFIAPVMADATRIDGRFSLSLSEFAAPLAADPGGRSRARAAGVLTIHAVDVLPGPAVAEWVGLVRQVPSLARGIGGGNAPSSGSALLSIREQAIEFQMANGRVHHRGLKFNVGDAVVSSEGSVGVDETLDLLLSVPILDKWIAENPELLGRLRGQSLRVPIRGTFSNPKIDRDAFQRLSQDLLQNAAAGAIDTGINLLLERLRSK